MVYKSLVISPPNVASQKSVQKSQFYKGFSTTNDSQLTTKIFDFNLIKQDIINMFQTKKGERVMNPAFGTVIWNYIFEPFTDDVKQLISDDVTRILNYDPRVTPTQINITEAPSGLIIEATLLYNKQNQVYQMQFSFDQEIGLTVTQQ